MVRVGSNAKVMYIEPCSHDLGRRWKWMEWDAVLTGERIPLTS
jgi:hypothetical protein